MKNVTLGLLNTQRQHLGLGMAFRTERRRQPAARSFRTGIEIGNVGFDVKQGRAVDHIHASHPKPAIPRAEQPYDREPEMIGPVR